MADDNISDGSPKRTAWNKGKKLGFVPAGAFKKGHKPWHAGKKVDPSQHPTFGHRKPHSEETKRKMSERRKGRTPWNLGVRGKYKHSAETRAKMGAARKGRPRPDVVENCRLMGLKYGGQKRSPEALRAMAEKLRGRTHTMEVRKRLSEAKKGPKNPAWRGGINPEFRALRGSMAIRIWRKAVLERDGRACVLCGTTKGPLHADHIKPFCDYPELRFDITNGRTLCFDCHKKTDTYGVNARKHKAKQSA